MNTYFKQWFPEHLSFMYQDMIEWINREHKQLAVTSPNVPPCKKKKITDSKVVLMDVYGTLLTSSAGEIGLTLPSQDSLTYPLFEKLAEKGIVFENLCFDELRGRLQEIISKTNSQSEKLYPEVDILAIWSELLTTLKSEGHYLGTVSDESVAWLSLIYEWSDNPCDIMPGSVAYLHYLTANNIPYGLVTNSQFYTPVILEALFSPLLPECTIDPQLCSWSFIQGEGKPSLEMFARVLAYIKDELKIAVADTIYIGNDMRNDIWTYQSMGGKGVLFAGDVLSLRLREDYNNRKKPDYQISSWTNLLDLYL